MGNAASRIFKVIQKTNVNTISEFISLTVSSTNPLTFTDGDKLQLPQEFCKFDSNIDIGLISVGDIFNAVTLNDNQIYYIQEVVKSRNNILKYTNDISALRSSLATLASQYSALNSKYTALEARVKKLEEEK